MRITPFIPYLWCYNCQLLYIFIYIIYKRTFVAALWTVPGGTKPRKPGHIPKIPHPLAHLCYKTCSAAIPAVPAPASPCRECTAQVRSQQGCSSRERLWAAPALSSSAATTPPPAYWISTCPLNDFPPPFWFPTCLLIFHLPNLGGYSMDKWKWYGT